MFSKQFTLMLKYLHVLYLLITYSSALCFMTMQYKIQLILYNNSLFCKFYPSLWLFVSLCIIRFRFSKSRTTRTSRQHLHLSSVSFINVLHIYRKNKSIIICHTIKYNVFRVYTLYSYNIYVYRVNLLFSLKITRLTVLRVNVNCTK